MTIKEAELLLDRFLTALMLSIGFRHIENLRFGRPEQDAIAILSFPLRLSVNGTGLFTMGAGLRVESISQWLDEDPTDMLSTIGNPINLLREDKYFTEWEFSNANDLENLRNIILDDLKTYALPYIERYSRLTDLRKALESPNKQDWFNTGLNVDSRVTVLAAILLVEGDKAGAITTLDDGIKALEDTLAGRAHELRKRRFAMDYLRERLLREDKES